MVAIHATSPPCADTTPSRRSRFTFSIDRTIGPFHGKSSASRPARAAVKASQRPSGENTGTPGDRPSLTFVSWRSVLATTLPIQIWPRRRNAIWTRSGASVKAPASASAPLMRAGFAAVADTLHNWPSLPKSSSPFDVQATAPMSDTSRCGSTGKSVSCTGVCPGVTTNRSCLPAASHRNATLVPSGDHVGLVGYLMSAMRSMVMLPLAGSACASPI